MVCIVCGKTIHKLYMEPYMGTRETKRQRDKESKRRRDEETKSGGVNGQRSMVKETKSGCLPQPLPKGKGFVAALMHRTWGSFFGDKATESGREGFSLEGYTVSNPGQRPGIAGGKEGLAWRAVRPRRWRREPL